MSRTYHTLGASLHLTSEENTRFLSALADYPEAVKVTLSMWDSRIVADQIGQRYEDSIDISSIYPDELEWNTDWKIEYHETNLRLESVGEEWGLIDPNEPYWFTWPHVKRHIPNFGDK